MMDKPHAIIEVEKIGDWETSIVSIGFTPEFEEDYGYLMTATEYLLNVACQRSHAGYERAMELICKGAMTYKSKKIE
jgi:hypothetical protein